MENTPLHDDMTFVLLKKIADTDESEEFSTTKSNNFRKDNEQEDN